MVRSTVTKQNYIPQINTEATGWTSNKKNITTKENLHQMPSNKFNHSNRCYGARVTSIPNFLCDHIVFICLLEK